MSIFWSGKRNKEMFYTKGHLIISYCINIQGNLSEQDISIARCDNRSNVGEKNEDMVDSD